MYMYCKNVYTEVYLQYEVPSIKNANLSIKYEWIKVQKWLIACKKGINVVVQFLYLEIGWLKNSTFHSQLSWTK